MLPLLPSLLSLSYQPFLPFPSFATSPDFFPILSYQLCLSSLSLVTTPSFPSHPLLLVLPSLFILRYFVPRPSSLDPVVTALRRQDYCSLSWINLMNYLLPLLGHSHVCLSLGGAKHETSADIFLAIFLFPSLELRLSLALKGLQRGYVCNREPHNHKISTFFDVRI